MKHTKHEEAVSEILGALLLVIILITGLSIVAVMLFSIPPPGSAQKAVLGVKCTWCEDSNQYDILIDHQGGESLELNRLRFILVGENFIKEIDTSTPGGQVYFPADPTHLYIPPRTCDNLPGTNWDAVTSFSTGNSLRYRFTPSLDVNGDPLKITSLVIQEPAPIGYSSIAHLTINYIQNLSTYGPIIGHGRQPIVAGSYFVTPSIDRSTLTYAADGCEVDFMYINQGDDAYYAWGSKGFPRNYIETFDNPPVLILEHPTVSDFITTPIETKVMRIKFIGYIEYRLGYKSTSITCNERIINYLKDLN